MTVEKSIVTRTDALRTEKRQWSGLQVNPRRRNAPDECEIGQSQERPAFTPVSVPRWPRVFPGL